MVEGARLESVYTATYRGFESLPLRHHIKKATSRVAFFYCAMARLEPRLTGRLSLGIWQVVKHRLKDKRPATFTGD